MRESHGHWSIVSDYTCDIGERVVDRSWIERSHFLVECCWRRWWIWIKLQKAHLTFHETICLPLFVPFECAVNVLNTFAREYGTCSEFAFNRKSQQFKCNKLRTLFYQYQVKVWVKAYSTVCVGVCVITRVTLNANIHYFSLCMHLSLSFSFSTHTISSDIRLHLVCGGRGREGERELMQIFIHKTCKILHLLCCSEEVKKNRNEMCALSP